MVYLFIFLGLALSLTPILCVRFLKKEKLDLTSKILTIILVAVFFARFLCYKDNITQYVDYAHLANKPYGNFVGIASAYIYWLSLTAILLVLFRGFFNFKSITNIVKFIVPVVLLLTMIDIIPIIGLLQGSEKFSILHAFYGIEIGMTIGLVVKYWLDDYSLKVHWKDCLFFIGMFFVMMIPCMPTWWPGLTFGYIRGTIRVVDFSLSHRIMFYLGAFILPFSIYFAFKNQPFYARDFALTFIAVGTLTNFLTRYDYAGFLEPWTWPWHLCNTAMFIIPVCLIFKAKRLFYFTIFINVAGALLAMLMPNYDEGINIFASEFIRFWYNHWCAFFMPILCIALGVFEKPKIKQFYFSLLFFFCYYVLMIFLNVYFTALGHDVDYFFINSDFVADKAGNWAVRIFNMKWEVTVGGLLLTFHPLYQTIYFIGYIIISLICWFCYTLGYDIADRQHQLYARLHEIKVDQLALEATLNGRSKELPMNEDAGIKFELKDFSKRYGNSKVYAVQHANLEVHGGEIFGFLGPNGAGKSTIIKTTVGIQPISEGHIEVCGYDIKKQSIQAKRQIGFVPDHYALYEQLSGREYINYIADIYGVSKEERDERINKYVELFQMETQIDNKIRTYSHGMKQKITIMSALVHNPKVWILDEPLTGLDPTSIFQVKQCMKEHAKAGNIVFFSSHIIDIVEKLCERIAIIKKGEIQCVTTVDEIEKSGKTLEQFYLETIGETLEEEKEEAHD